MKPSFIFSAVTAVVLCSLLKSWVSAQVSKACFCELQNLGQAFPSDKLEEILRTSTACTRSATEEQLTEVETLLDSLHYRLLDLEKDVKDLEEAKDEGMYGIISLRIIEIELNEISDLLIRLNSTTRNHQALTVNLGPQLRNLRTELGKLADFDRMQVVKKEQENKRLKRHLSVCETDLRMTPAPHKDPAPGNCPFGRLLNVTGPTSSMLTEYDSSYPYGAWGKDPKPAPGKESWYWLVVLSSSSCYGSFVRTYTSRSAQIVAQYAGDVTVTSSVTTTNSIMGPGSVMYNNAYYYNCYYSPNVCRFDMETKTITTRALPGAGANGKFPYCHLTACYSCTDIDLSTDESGLWVIYASEENFGNVVLSRLNATSTLDILETWRTSLVKKAVTNAFIACGVLYATRLVNNNYEEIFYSFDTVTGIERGNLSIRFRKPSAYIYSLNYNPRDRNLYAYNDAYIVTYQTVFG